jgi:hypothetical protein
MSVEDELFGIRMELKNQREVVSGLKEVDRAQKGVTSSTTKTGVAAERAEKKTSRLGTAFAGLGTKAKWALGFLGVSGVFALESAVHETENLAMATSGLSRNFGFSTNVASRWAAVMHSREVDPKALSQAFGTLSAKMVEAAREGGTSLTAFHLLGLTQEDVAHGARDYQWGLLRVADALGEAEGGSKRAAAAKALLGKGFQTLTPLFSEGAEGLKEQLHWADEYGVTLSTTTKDGLMEMVTGQRELKVASLGLQVALTRALMPAIEGGENQVKEFIKTLNDPNLTTDEKIHRIEEQFLGLEDTLIEIVTDALPRVAEHGGELGVKLAGAVVHGFLESDVQGKIVISAWMLHAMGGLGAVSALGGQIGRMLAFSIAAALFPRLAEEFAITGSIGLMIKNRWLAMGEMGGRVFVGGLILGAALLGYELGKYIATKHPDTAEAFRRWGINAGQNFVNGMIEAVQFGLDLIADKLDDANFLAFAGVDAPNAPTIGHVNWEEIGKREPGKPGSGQVGWDEVPEGAGKEHIPPQHSPRERHEHHRHGHGASGRGRAAGASRDVGRLPRRGDRVLQPIHTQLLVDGRTLAEIVRHHVISDEALG